MTLPMSSHLFAAPTMKTPIAVVCSLLLALGAQLPCAAKPPSTGMSEVPGAKPFVFKSSGEVSLKLYVFNPPDHKASDARPALVLFFGGGWMHGDPSQFVKHAAYFASRGMVVVLPEYRTKEAHGTTPLECIADGKSAVRWVRAHATELGIDPQRIAAGGGSAGGHVAASTAVLSDIEEQGAATKVSCVPNALVLFNPVLDTTATGYGAKKLGERAQDASPVHHVRAGLPPTIIFHGEADKTVPFENARRFTDEMTKAGNVCTLMGYEGQDHGFYIRGEPRYYAIVLREADKFLARLGWLTGEPTQPEPARSANPVPSGAAEPFLKKEDVFVRGADGYHTYRIPGLVATRSGALLLFCDGRVNSGGDIGKMNLVLKRSLDGGKSWKPMQVLYSDDGPDTKIGNVSVVVDQKTGAVHAIFCKNLTQAYRLTSTDDGKTFHPAAEITRTFRQFPFAWKFFATGHAHGIQLTSGRLMIPVFLSAVPRVGGGELRDFRVGTIFSDDHGATWKAGGLIPEDPLLNESTLYEAADGAVVMNSRSAQRSARMIAHSADAGLTWSPPTGDATLRAPSACQASTLVTRDPAGRRVVLFSHSAGPSRANLTVRASYDDGKTWPVAKVLHPGPAAYGDLALGPDGTIYLGYENGVKGPYEKLSVARFNIEWLLAKDGDTQAPPAVAAKLSSVVVDDSDAEFTGKWIESRAQTPLVGRRYRHDGATDRGRKTALFTPDLPTAGEYEVRLLYPAISKAASNTKVTVVSADGDKSLTVNQRETPIVNGVARAIGVFRFEAGKKGAVILSNAGADGFVIADGVQFVPLEVANAERAAATALVPPKTPPLREPVPVAKAAEPADIDGKSYDLVVIGGTPGGIACAVRAAREGLRVLLVQHYRHIGGMLANGLFQWDALYAGHRAPIFNEYAHMIEEHYRRTYGAKSAQYRAAEFTQTHYPMSRFEPSVAEREFNRLVAAERNITLLLAHYPSAVERDGTLLRGVTLSEYGGARKIKVQATIFADATYEGDLAAVAKVPYRVGREGRDEYGEPHAGKLFSNIVSERGPRDAIEGRLNLHPYAHQQGSIAPASPFTADTAIQAYNYRFCISNDPQNRRLPEKPATYRREEYLNYTRREMNGGALNGKATFNSAILPGENHAYPDADWPTREKIIQRHKDFALGLMYFLQNDESVPAAKREEYRQVGLPLDEFPDNENIPYELYVREARRIVGRHVFTEHDNVLAPGLARTPIHTDSIAITDWSMDSHDCTTDRRPGYAFDGKLILTEESRPAQIPYRTLLPQGVDNLLVPVCLSATHVGWGAVRLEPVWMQAGESAGFAAALAKKHGVTPAALDSDLLVRTLCKAGCVVSFFNEKEALQPAVQYFGTKGFFSDYDARLNEPLKKATAKLWADNSLDPNARARAVAEAEKSAEAGTTTRGDMLRGLYQQLH